MPIVGSDLKVVTELSLAKIAGDGITADAGHAYQAAITWATAAAINSGIAVVAAIEDPEAGDDEWTEIISLSGSRMIVEIDAVATYDALIYIIVNSGEDADDALRAQIKVDGTTVADITCVKAAGHVTNSIYGPSFTSYTDPHCRFECNSSFLIQAAREGTFAVDDSEFDVGLIHYFLIA